MRRGILALAALLTLAGCGGSDGDDANGGEAVATTPAPATTTAAATTEPEDVAGRSNCTSAGLAYAPIAGGLDGSVDLESAIGFFTAPDIDPATSDAGKAAAVAIAEANLELTLANADVLTGQAVDEARLSELLDDVDATCAALR